MKEFEGISYQCLICVHLGKNEWWWEECLSKVFTLDILTNTSLELEF